MGYLKVMIVDDDRLSVDYIEHLVCWEDYGYQVVGKAYNGKQALKMFRKYNPHLLITDISMPLIDGIELTREVKQLNPDTRTILLTAYSEFEYARAAVSAGVDFYIIKDEMNQEVLSEKLREISKTIGNIQHVSGILFQKALLDYFLEGKELVKERYSIPEIREFFEQEHLCILIERNRRLRAWETQKNEEGGLSAAEIISLLQRGIQQEEICHYGLGPNDSVLIFLEPYRETYRNFQRIQNLCRQMKELIDKQERGRFTYYFSGHSVNCSRVDAFIRQCLPDYSFLYGTGRMYDLTQCPPVSVKGRETVREESAEIFYQEEDAAGYRSYVEASLNPELLEAAAIRKNCETFIRVHEKLTSVLQPESAEIPEGIRLYDVEEVKDWLIRHFDRYLEIRGAGKYRPEVRTAMKYIRENYSRENLAIAELAEVTGISSSRLSVLFKQDTKMTVNQYLTKVRIHHAKELLSSGVYKVYEVAEMVGYGTSQYLSRIFYKETGCYPAEYKRKV